MLMPTDRRDYLKDYRQKMKARVKRVSLTFSASEYAAFEAAASVAGEKPASFVKALALQALHHEVALPEAVESELAELSRLVRNVANNVNQMARHSNRIARVLDDNEPLLEVARLDALLRAALKKLVGEEL